MSIQLKNENLKDTAIYLHIPFCDHKCIYCDFYSIISYENVSTYLKAIKREITFYAEKYSDDRSIISIYFGGGTPSLMNPEYISELIDHVRKNFSVREDAEITLETNPGTINKQKFLDFKKNGINRISIGIQSFINDDLKFLTRIHNAETAIQTVQDSLKAGFENNSIDLIFNLPKQTKEKWQFNLETALQLPIKHISAYSLILEPGTILNKMVRDNKVEMQDDDYDADLYEYTIDYLTQKGFVQYEVSNFAQSGFECVHNNAYWQYKDYLGFGTSAHSFINGKRWWNFSSLKFYLNSFEAKDNAVAGEEILTKKEMLNEYIMLAFRSRGLNLIELEKLFGQDWIRKNNEILNQLEIEKYLIRKNMLLSLTSKGYAICDEIIKNLNS